MAGSPIRISHFGGLVTAEDENLLAERKGPLATAYAQNADGARSGGITRRAGCSSWMNAPLTSQASIAAALTRIGRVSLGGVGYTIAHATDKLWGKADSGTHVPAVTAQAESLIHTGGTLVTDSRFAGGKALMVSGTSEMTVTVPACNALTARIDTDFGGKVQVKCAGSDQDTYADRAAPTFTPTGVTPATSGATHVLSVKPCARNAQAGMLTATAGQSVYATRAVAGGPIAADIFLPAPPVGQQSKVLVEAVGANWSASITAVLTAHQAGYLDVVFAYENLGPGPPSYGMGGISNSRPGWFRFSLGDVARVGAVDDASGVCSYLGFAQPPNTVTAPIALRVHLRNLVGSNTKHVWVDSVTAAGVSDDILGTAAALPTNWTCTPSGSFVVNGSTYETFVNAYIDTVTYSTDVSSDWTALADTAGPVSWAVFGDKLYFADADTALKKWPGTGAAASATAGQPGSVLVEAKERLFQFAPSDDPGFGCYSDVYESGDPANMGTNTWPPWAKGSGRAVLAAIAFRDSVLAFAADAVFEMDISGDPTTAWHGAGLSPTASKSPNGLIAPNAVATGANAVYWLSSVGVRALGVVPGLASTEGGPDIDVSEDIASTLALAAATPLAADACMEWHRGCLWLAVSLPTDDEAADLGGNPLRVLKPTTHATTDSGKVDAVFIFQPGDALAADAQRRSPRWYGPFVYLDAAGETLDIRSLYTSAQDDYALLAGAADGRIYRLDTGTSDCGNPIPMTWRIPPVSPGGPGSRTHFRRGHLAAAMPVAQELVVRSETELASTPPATLAFAVEEAETLAQFEISLPGSSLATWLYSAGTADAPATISTVEYDFDPPRR
jgi:hypothetical protein